MGDFGMKRNGYGYYDATAYNAVMDMAKPGEIWETSMGKEYLILKNHGTMCTVLALNDHNRNDEGIEIVSRQIRYTNPAMVQYLFNTTLAQFIKTIPDDLYRHVMEEVSEKIGLSVKVVQVDTEAQLKELREELEYTRKRADELGNELLIEQAQYKESQIARVELTKELAELREKACNSKEIAQAEAKAEWYKQLYDSLLDKMLARGAAI